MILAHGIGGRSDLPLPLWMFGYGAAAALLVSFAALVVFWREPRLDRASPGRLLTTTQRPWTQLLLGVTRALGLALFVLVLATALFGTDDAGRNLAPVTVYVIFWVGLTVVSALVGDAWRPLDPYLTLGRGLATGESRYPLGMWPAAAGLLGFVWLELVHPSGASPRVIGVAIVVYTATVLTGAARWGRPFLRQGEAFAAWFGLLGAMAPVGAGDDGRVRLRVPLTALPRVEPAPGMLALVMVALGSTAFDGITRTQVWTDIVADLDPWPGAAVATIGLLWAIGIVTLLYGGAMKVASTMVGGSWRALADDFVHTLVPIAFGYAVAHYASLLLFEGQAVFALVSDPFGKGWDLFGTADHSIDFTWVSVRTIAWIQAAAIVAGHVAGVVLAHDRALARFPAEQATRSQYPLLAVMVAFTVGGLALLLGG